MLSSVQKRIAEANGVFDLSGRTGVAPAPPAPAATPKKTPVPTAKPSGKEGGGNNEIVQQVERLIASANGITTASANLENSAAYIRTIKKGGQEISAELDKVRGHLLNIAAGIKQQVIEVSDNDPEVARRVRAWLTGAPKDEAVPQKAPAPPPVPTPAPPPAPVPAPPAAPPQVQARMVPPPAEDLLNRIDIALMEQGVTKERREASKRKTEVWQREKTGTKNTWYTKGIKGNGYGSGGKFNDH